jgi:large subunit ribosomal protein L40
VWTRRDFRHKIFATFPVPSAMSSALLAPVRARAAAAVQPLRVSQTSVRYAGRKTGGADPKLEILRRVLYPSNLRSRSSPTGTWRPDVGRAVQRAIPSVQAHETIERAWLLHERHVRQAREAERARKFACMKEAMDTLHELDPELYRAANRVEDPRHRTPLEMDLSKTLKGPEKRALEGRIRGLFPRDLRPPTDTPPREGWKYDWTPVKRTTTSTASCKSFPSHLQPHVLTSTGRILRRLDDAGLYYLYTS